MLSFVVFAIFAYGGIEAVGGLVDKTEQPEKNFAKGIVIAAVVISVGYSLAIVLWGVSANWQQVLSNPSTNLGNITYVLMTRLGATLANAMHLPSAVAAERIMVCQNHRTRHVPRLYRRFLYPELLAVKGDYSGHAKSALAFSNDAN